MIALRNQAPAYFYFSVLLIVLTIASGLAQNLRKEVHVGFTSIDKIRPAMDRALSPTGKFLYFQNTGNVLVIDDIEHIAAAEKALAQLDIPAPDIHLLTAFKTGISSTTATQPVGQTVRSIIEFGREVPFPVQFNPPQIPNRVGGNSGAIVTPATPTRFETRFIGTRSDIASTLNPNGTVTLDINSENTSFEGFINYGTPITVQAGNLGNVGISGQAANPTFFQSVIPNNILVPIIGRTRISTSVVVWPRVTQGNVQVDLMPRLTIETAEEGAEELEIDLAQYRTTMVVPNNGVSTIKGFTNASDDFNRHFLGAENTTNGGTEIILKAQIRRPTEHKEEDDLSLAPPSTTDK